MDDLLPIVRGRESTPGRWRENVNVNIAIRMIPFEDLFSIIPLLQVLNGSIPESLNN